MRVIKIKKKLLSFYSCIQKIARYLITLIVLFLLLKVCLNAVNQTAYSQQRLNCNRIASVEVKCKIKEKFFVGSSKIIIEITDLRKALINQQQECGDGICNTIYTIELDLKYEGAFLFGYEMLDELEAKNIQTKINQYLNNPNQINFELIQENSNIAAFFLFLFISLALISWIIQTIFLIFEDIEKLIKK
ncbi:MAG: hypothetical protein ACYTXE_30555 [Nostoc sp.]